MIDRLADLVRRHSYVTGLALALLAAGAGWILAGESGAPAVGEAPAASLSERSDVEQTPSVAEPSADIDEAVVETVDADSALLDDGSDRVVLRALDKITARITDLEVPVGESAEFGSLVINVRYCRKRPPEEPPETFAYLEIDDLRLKDASRVFDGWMMSSSPALNPLEHPVYDVWVINCTMVSADASADRR